ncbi:MAG TPA: C39 family peptidase [Methanosarcina sp.]|jgi:hypothetical protein
MDLKDSKPPSHVPEEKAREHAHYSIKKFLAHSTFGFESWDNFQIEHEPLLIKDLNGHLLFYEYTVNDGKKPLGLIRVAASKIIGSTTLQIQITPRGWDPHLAIKKAKEKVKEYLPKTKIISADFISYSYPKIGVSINVEDSEIGEGSLIFDAGSFDFVEPIGDFGREGAISWSFYNSIALPKAEVREKRWNALDKEMASLKESVEGLGEESSTKIDKLSLQQNLLAAQHDHAMKVSRIGHKYRLKKDLETETWTIKPTEFCTQKIIKHSPLFCKNHKTNSGFSQQKTDYCAVATGQMILDFYRYYYSQDEIASAMGYAHENGGCTPEGQVAGYTKLSNNSLKASVDTGPTWDKAAAEIDANRPLKSGIPGHSRACFGYKVANFWDINMPRPMWLFIFDPWPPNSDFCKGNHTWEDWYSIPHTNFIYASHISK